MESLPYTQLLSSNIKPIKGGLVVLGAGLPRTGTSSLREALKILLKGPCHHMISVFDEDQSEVKETPEKNFQFWNRAMTRKLDPSEWREFFESRGYCAGLDYPVALFYREIMEAYPDIKIILGVRDPHRWFKSVRDSIYTGRSLFKDPTVQVYTRLSGEWGPRDCSLRSCTELYDVIEKGEEESVQFFNDWVAEVKKNVPEDRLLLFQAKEGWQPLCEFLGVPVPDVPYPNINDTGNILGKYGSLQMRSRIFCLLVVLPIWGAVLSMLLGLL